MGTAARKLTKNTTGYTETSKQHENDESSAFVSVPSTFEKSSDPDRQLGEEAEEIVYERLKNTKISGLKLNLFNGQRYIGKRKVNDEIVREKDFSVFIEYLGKFYTMLIEVKCCQEESNPHRKKALSQLVDHCKVLEVTHGLPKSQVEKVMQQTAWPRLSRE